MWGVEVEIASQIDWLEWIVISMYAVAFVYCLWLLVNAQGDLLVNDAINTISGGNDDQLAMDMFIDLIEATKKSIVIHDDGDDSPTSVYNNKKVMDCLRSRVQDKGIHVQCLFN